MATAGENGRENKQFPDERKVNVAPWGKEEKKEMNAELNKNLD